MFLFLSLARSTVFGIDFGYEYIKVAMAAPGRGVHVALNQQSKRLSPSYFAIWNTSDPKTPVAAVGRLTPDQLSECSWSFLDAAKSHSLRFPHNMIKGLSPMLSTANGFTRRTGGFEDTTAAR
jgi:molecular chaperone DnaK (HSP70)